MNTSLKKPKSAPFQTDQRFSQTKTGVVGLQRESMLKNELHYLVKTAFISILHRCLNNY